ncbi:hypothetical protein [Burkholderia pseudomallei]|uniref:hypothetical protein n=1 Tax=Burkholderia pseudomallei TaxID=28450 RepID=UPI001177F592|nr:hypothetical protein [Burkholderia pseudomallei]
MAYLEMLNKAMHAHSKDTKSLLEDISAADGCARQHEEISSKDRNTRAYRLNRTASGSADMPTAHSPLAEKVADLVLFDLVSTLQLTAAERHLEMNDTGGSPAALRHR